MCIKTHNKQIMSPASWLGRQKAKRKEGSRLDSRIPRLFQLNIREDYGKGVRS